MNARMMPRSIRTALRALRHIVVVTPPIGKIRMEGDVILQIIQRDIRGLLGAAGLVVASMVAAAPSAHAQGDSRTTTVVDRSRPELDPLGVRVGGVSSSRMRRFPKVSTTTSSPAIPVRSMISSPISCPRSSSNRIGRAMRSRCSEVPTSRFMPTDQTKITKASTSARRPGSMFFGTSKSPPDWFMLICTRAGARLMMSTATSRRSTSA